MVSTGNNIRLDRNVIQNIDEVLPETIHFEMAVDLIFYLSHLSQSNTGTLFSNEILTEFPITAKGFMEFTSRKKGSVYEDSGWHKEIPVLDETGQVKQTIKLSSVFERILWDLRYSPIPLAFIYDRHLKNGTVSKRASLGTTFLDSLTVELGKSYKTKEKVFYVSLNEFLAKSFLDQFLTVRSNDLVKIRGNRKNSLYRVYFFLMLKENQQRDQLSKTGVPTPVKATYADIKRVSNIEIKSEDESSNISKTVAKFKSYLNQILESSSADFSYTVENNNFYFDFNLKGKFLTRDYKRNVVLLNLRKDIEVILKDENRKIDSYTEMPLDLKNDLSKRLLLKYVSVSSVEFVASRTYYSSILSELFQLSTWEVENMITQQDLKNARFNN